MIFSTILHYTKHKITPLLVLSRLFWYKPPLLVQAASIGTAASIGIATSIGA